MSITIRTPITNPVPCFGMEQKQNNALCPTCQHKVACREQMGRRFGQVTVDQAKFNLLPSQLDKLDLSPLDIFTQVYQECYHILFRNEFKPDSLYSMPELPEHVTNEAAKLKCPIKLFVLTVMWGHKLAHPMTRFYCKMLAGEAAAKRVQRYRAEVESQFGVFTEKTLDYYASDSIGGQTCEQKLLQAEVQAGDWIVGYKTRHAGQATEPFYETNELSLPVIWLATEPSYVNMLAKWRENKVGSVEQAKHRTEAAKLIGELHRQSKRAATIFKAREAIMPQAIKKVLNNKGFDPAYFYTAGEQIWTSTPLFWGRLGLALQQYWCWELLHGSSQQALRQLSVGTVY